MAVPEAGLGAPINDPAGAGGGAAGVGGRSLAARQRLTYRPGQDTAATGWMRIEAITLRNFKVFRSVELRAVPAYAVFVGANGVGKTTLFDVFGLLRDCLQDNVRSAVARRGGFRELLTRNAADRTIAIELKLRMPLPVGPRIVTYSLEVAETNGRVVVGREVLKYTRFRGGRPYTFLDFRDGAGSAITNEPDLIGDNPEHREDQKLAEPDILAIKGLGQFQQFEAARAFRALIENWHVSDFHVQSARPSQEAGYAEHLSTQGDNLPLVAQYMYEQHRPVFDRILERMAARVPGVSRVEPTMTVDGRLVLRFQDGAFRDPFLARWVSDGTIKMFAYLLLLHDPRPHPLLCVEEPENQLYPLLLQELSEEFEDYARRGGQVMVSTHSPDLLNAVQLDSIFVMSKREGVTTIHPARDSERLRSLVAEGDLPGAAVAPAAVRRRLPVTWPAVVPVEAGSARVAVEITRRSPRHRPRREGHPAPGEVGPGSLHRAEDPRLAVARASALRHRPRRLGRGEGRAEGEAHGAGAIRRPGPDPRPDRGP